MDNAINRAALFAALDLDNEAAVGARCQGELVLRDAQRLAGCADELPEIRRGDDGHGQLHDDGCALSRAARAGLR